MLEADKELEDVRVPGVRHGGISLSMFGAPPKVLVMLGIVPVFVLHGTVFG